MKKLLFLSLFLFSCGTQSPQELLRESNQASENDLEGTWYASGTLDDGNFSWFVEYRFKDGTYSKSGYPPIYEEGTFEVSGDTILFTSSKDVASIQAYNLSKDGQTLDISGLTFSYVK